MRRTGLLAAMALMAGTSAAFAGFTAVNAPPPGEPGQAGILGELYGGTFTPVGNGYTNGKLTFTRLDDSFDSTYVLGAASPRTAAYFASDAVLNTPGSATSAHSLSTGGRTLFSSPAENEDGRDQMIAYQFDNGGTVGYALFWEDGTPSVNGDYDYNDFAIGTAAIPLPPAAWMGLLTLGGMISALKLRRRT